MFTKTKKADYSYLIIIFKYFILYITTKKITVKKWFVKVKATYLLVLLVDIHNHNQMLLFHLVSNLLP